MRRCIAMLSVVVCGFGFAEAQIIEFREVDGKAIQCIHSGLMSDLNDCDSKSDWYAYVFVGSITAIIPADKGEKRLEITPEEVFHGEPPIPVTVLTQQGACLPPLAAGDRWLFFLRKEDNTPILLDYYGNDSRPVADAQEQIETLRRLKTIGDFGILRGSVERGPTFLDKEPVPGARVVASRKSDNSQFFVTTDSNGRFEFEPLGPGRYDLTVNPVESFRPDDSDVELARGACRDLTISRSPHAQIGGHVRRPDGSPVANATVVSMEEGGYNTRTSDSEGHYSFDEMRPGTYVVGVDLPGAAGKYGSCGGASCVPPPLFLFYPGVHNRSDALAIFLAEDEKRDDIDFILPTK